MARATYHRGLHASGFSDRIGACENRTSKKSTPDLVNDTVNELFQSAIRSIDTFNRQDPRTWTTESGHHEPYELAYAAQISRWVLTLSPNAPEETQIAARAMHIGRWLKPRDTYPSGLNGYLQWREDLKQHHADLTTEVLAPLGYDANRLARIQSLIRKEDLEDPTGQLLEDALCLVFLEHQLSGFMAKHDETKVIDIVRKTWGKMSEQGREAALGITYSNTATALVHQAVG